MTAPPNNLIPIKNPETNKVEFLNPLTGELAAPLSSDELYYSRNRPFDLELATSFLELVREGTRFKSAATQLGLTVADIHSWRRRYAPFASRLQQAFEDSTFLLEQEMHELADEVLNAERMVEVDKIKAGYDMKKTLAEISNRGRFGHKGEAGGGGVQIIIQTGVPDREKVSLARPNDVEVNTDGTV